MPQFQNRITELRRVQHVPQRALAEAVGLTTGEFQRVEAGIMPVHIDIAMGIGQLLGHSLEEVFPATREALTSMRRAHMKFDGALRLPTTERARKVHDSFLVAGIEFDVRRWTLKAWIRHRKPVQFRIPPCEQRRLWSAFQEQSRDHFVIFDAQDVRVGLNLQHLLGWQFLWDVLVTPTEVEPQPQLIVHMADERRAVRFGIEDDREQAAADGDDEDAQLQQMLELLQIVDDEDGRTIVSFTDEDGERAFFRAADIAYLEVPLHAVESTLAEVLYHAEDDDQPEMPQEPTDEPSPLMIQ